MSISMLKILFLVMSFSFAFCSEAQCFQKLSEPQDTSSYQYAIANNGELYEIYAGAMINVIYPGIVDWHRIFTGSDQSGYKYALALKQDSSLWEFGENTALSQIGVHKWKDVSFMWDAFCAVKSNGTLWRWGAGISSMTQFGNETNWKNIEVFHFWQNNWSQVKLLGTKTDGSMWLYDFSSANPQWIQLGIGMQWDFIKFTPSLNGFSIYAINTSGDLNYWSSPVLNATLIGSGQWKKISNNGFGHLISGLKTDGSVYTWSISNVNPTLLTNSDMYNDIDINNPGLLALKSSNLSYFPVGYVNNTMTILQSSIPLGVTCCTDSINLFVTSCGDYIWNNQILDTTGVYTINFTNGMGCDSIVNLHLTINNSPNEPILNLLNDTTITTQIQSVSYQWINCQNQVALMDDTLSYLSISSDGSFAVIVSNQCGSDTSLCIDVNYGDLDDHQNLDFRVFPNPSFNFFNVHDVHNSNGKAFIVTDLSGRKIVSGFILNTSCLIDLSSESPGIYILSIENQRNKCFLVKE